MTDTKQIIKEAWARALELASETDGWKEEKRSDTAQLMSKHYAGCAMNCFRVTGQVNMSPQEFVDWLWEWELNEWKSFESQIKDWQVVEEVDSNVRVVRQVVKPGWPVTNRDMCLAWGRVQSDDGTCAVVCVSMEHEKVPKTDKHVRAQVLMNAFILTPAEAGKSTLTRIFHIDPAGNIPSAIFNKASTMLHKAIDKFNDLVGSRHRL